MSKELTKEEVYKKHYHKYLDDGGIHKDFIYNAMQEYSDQNTKPLIDEIAKLKALKSEANEAVDWDYLRNEFKIYCHDSGGFELSYQEQDNIFDFFKMQLSVYEIFKTRNNK